MTGQFDAAFGLRYWLTAPATLRLEFDDCAEATVTPVPVVERELNFAWP